MVEVMVQVLQFKRGVGFFAVVMGEVQVVILQFNLTRFELRYDWCVTRIFLVEIEVFDPVSFSVVIYRFVSG